MAKWIKSYSIANVPPKQYWIRRKSGWTHEDALRGRPIKPKGQWVLPILNDDQVREVRRLIAEDALSLRAIGRRFNCSHYVLLNIRDGKTYKHVT